VCLKKIKNPKKLIFFDFEIFKFDFRVDGLIVGKLENTQNEANFIALLWCKRHYGHFITFGATPDSKCREQANPWQINFPKKGIFFCPSSINFDDGF